MSYDSLSNHAKSTFLFTCEHLQIKNEGAWFGRWLRWLLKLLAPAHQGPLQTCWRRFQTTIMGKPDQNTSKSHSWSPRDTGMQLSGNIPELFWTQHKGARASTQPTGHNTHQPEPYKLSPFSAWCSSPDP